MKKYNYPVIMSDHPVLHIDHITVQEYPDGLVLIGDDEHVTAADVMNLPNSVLSFVQTRIGGYDFAENVADKLLYGNLVFLFGTDAVEVEYK